MDLRLDGKSISGEVSAPASKSQAHRALICAALADRETVIDCKGISADIEATISCLSALGAIIERDGDSIKVRPVCAENAAKTLDCGESGSTLRFLLPVAAALGGEYNFTGHGRLPERPIAELNRALRSGGAVLSADRLPLGLSGKLKSGKYTIPGNISSQYISGLLMALPLTGGDCEIEIEGKTESEPYIDLTLSVMKSFGVTAEKTTRGYFIPGGAGYASPGRFAVEGDWSNAAFWLCMGAVGASPVTCTGLDEVSAQGDKEIVSILKRFGARVEESGGRVTVYPSRLKGISLNAENIPDLVPVIAVTAAAAQGETVITGAARLRLKESDRIAAVVKLLSGLGCAAEERPDGMMIPGGGLRGGSADSENDHRIAMSAAVASVFSSTEVSLSGAEACAKSYKNFFEEFSRLGGVAR